MRFNKRLIPVILIMTICTQLFVGCGKEDPVTDTADDQEEYADEEWYDDEEYAEDENLEEESYEEADQREELTEETFGRAIAGNGIVTSFISEQFYDGTINSNEDALEAVYSVTERIGGDQTTEFVLDAVDSTEDGIDFYTFRQAVGTVSVYGASAKLITDANKKAIGLVSAIMPDLQAPPENIWSITGPEAEEVVKDACNDDNIRIYSKATEQTLIPLTEGIEQSIYVWLVYTDNTGSDTDTGNKVDAAYTAHYVSCEGEYLNSIPVTDIGNKEALSGSTAAFAFKNMESDEWSGTVRTLSGKKKTVKIPIMVDPDTGEQYLGDVNRKILCAMQPDFEYEDTLTPCIKENGKWDDEYVITYYNYIQIYDLYETTGWIGPDGEGTPTLLLMGAQNEDGSPLDNACYTGKKQGFQVFEFDSSKEYGECTDIVGHEFTHCVTGTLMTANLYLNDYGAINEAMSDILGNLAAMMTDNEDEPFLIGEKLPEGMRSMKDPNACKQPKFVGDRFYVPSVSVGNDHNDNGGVHTNSSLLNYISYKLNQAGMEPEDEFYYWMNIARAMTSRTDYKQMAQILPWVMTTFGDDEYEDVVKNAVSETGIDKMVISEDPPEGLARVSFDILGADHAEDKTIVVSLEEFESGISYQSWPGAGSERVNVTIPKGKYLIYIIVNDPETEKTTVSVYNDGEWKTMDEEDFGAWLDNNTSMELLVNVTDGDVINLEEADIS